MPKIIIEPLKQRKEILAVSIAAVSIVLVAWLLIALRSGESGPNLKLKYYQVNAVKAFEKSPADYKIFSDIYTTMLSQITSSKNITYKQDGTPVFPNIQSLRATNRVPLLEGGLLYKKYGDHIWKKADLTNAGKKQFLNVYYGVSQKPNVAGSFLVVLEGVYQLDGVVNLLQNDRGRIGRIWYKKGRHTLPADVSDGMLIKEGWKEVVNISGKDIRNKGDKK